MLLRKLNSKLHLIEDPGNKSYISFLGYTDYAGDIANFLINKPAHYRIFYYSKSDLYVIGDAGGFTHYDFYRIAKFLGLIPNSSRFSHEVDYSDYDVGARLEFASLDADLRDELYLSMNTLQTMILKGSAAQLTTGYLIGNLKEVPDLLAVLRQRQALVKIN